MFKKDITKDKFFTDLKSKVFNIPKLGKLDYETFYVMKGGRGFVMNMQRMFKEEFINNQDLLNAGNLGVVKDTSIGLKAGFIVQKLFVSGLGWLEIDHDRRFDSGVNRDLNQEIVAGLPECSYEGELYIKEGEELKSLGFMTSLMEAPYQSIEDLLKHFGYFVERTKDSLEEFKKELANLELKN